MSHPRSDKPRPELLVTRDEARRRIADQVEKARAVPNESVNENDEARRWYEYTEELLRQLFSTDELADEFVGRGQFSFGDDISTGHYLKRLISISDRLDLYREHTPAIKEPAPVSASAIIEHLFSRFHAIVKQLHKRHDDRPTLDVTDEYDVQDLLHALLQLYFDDIRPEEWTPSYAGGSSRMDFLLKNEKVVIEVKKTRNRLGTKELGDQLSVDILRYRKHPDCKCLTCFVYDPEERIPNPRGLEHDLSQPIDSLSVRVYIAQK